MDKEYKIAFLAKDEKPGVNEALEFLNKTGFSVTKFLGALGDPFPAQLNSDKFDIIVSYISPWIVPVKVLNQTKLWNINFHPGPPEYPGIGCFNFALYNGDRKFGCTAHIMEEKVDTGKIIAVTRFEVKNCESVSGLADDTYAAILCTLKDVFSYIVKNNTLPFSSEQWTRKPYKRKELEELATIQTDMNEEELDKRIRATYFPGKPAPFIELFGHRFEYNPKR